MVNLLNNNTYNKKYIFLIIIIKLVIIDINIFIKNVKFILLLENKESTYFKNIFTKDTRWSFLPLRRNFLPKMYINLNSSFKYESGVFMCTSYLLK